MLQWYTVETHEEWQEVSGEEEVVLTWAFGLNVLHGTEACD